MNELLFSVVIPTKYQKDLLIDSLERNLQFKKQYNFEIILVNDNNFPLEIPENIKNELTIIENNAKGVSIARNLGVKTANSEWILLLDDDMWLDDSVFQWFIHTSPNAYNKSVYNFYWEYPAELQKKMLQTKVGVYLNHHHYHTMLGRLYSNGCKPNQTTINLPGIGSCALLISKHNFNEVGGYDPSYKFQGEDIYLSQVLNEKGYEINGILNVTLWHNHASRIELNSYLKREYNGYIRQFRDDPRFKKNKTNIVLWSLLCCLEFFAKLLYYLIPNSKLTKPISLLLVGKLSGIQKFKALYSPAYK